MSMKRNISIDGREVAFKASAAIPRIYRMKFHRDIFKDLRDLEKGIDKNDPENSSLDMFSLEMFENIAYVMAKHADPSIPDTPEEWLDGFNTFSIYQVLPQLGLSIRDLDLLTIGMVNDMYIESRNDEHKYAVVATQKDFDQF